MLIKILIGLAAIILVLVVVISLRPSDFRVVRSGVIPAAPDAVFPHVNDMHKWQAWSPWAKIDPNCKISYSGPEAGVGAAFTWAGNNEVGEGTMAITESQPYDHIRFKLDFLKPMSGTCATLFTFKPENGGTLVTWDMSGKNGFMAKAFGLFVDCDKMVGGQFEQGLNNLKAIVETSGKQTAATP